MKDYQCTERGTFQNKEYAKQLVSFEGMKFEGRNGQLNVTPTDIDGLIQLDTLNCFVFFELKHSGGVPKGQRDALRKLVDTADKGGANSIAFVAIHNTEYPENIIAKDAKVESFYYEGRWYRLEGLSKTLYELINSYLENLKHGQQEDK